MPTRIVNSDFNDLNLEEPTRYIKHAGKCHFLGNISLISYLSRFLSLITHYLWQLTLTMELSATSNQAMQATPTGPLRHSTSISTRLSQIPSFGHSTFRLLVENLQNTTDICCWEESVLEDWYLPRIKLWYFSILCIFISKTNKLIARASWKNKCFVILLHLAFMLLI